MKRRTETLPTAEYKDGKWHLTEPYIYDTHITCTVVGQMVDGAKVWEDEHGNQYFRYKLYGRYYFCKA